jgi:Mrp family chromosome partitioning ATPase
MVGTNEKPEATDDKVIPIEREGLKLISIGFLIPEDQPVVWRGPMVHGALTQFLTQVEWGELDYLLIDMPPGTGDVQLTICQNAPLAGAVVAGVTAYFSINFLLNTLSTKKYRYFGYYAIVVGLFAAFFIK